MASLGYREVELIPFEGFSGTSRRDGFGPLAPLHPWTIRATIEDSGLGARGTHVKYAELDDNRIDSTLEWAHSLDLTYLTVADLGQAETLDDWKWHFERLNYLGEYIAEADFRLGVHTPNELWRRLDGILVMDAFLESVDPRACQIQLELSTAQNNGVENAEFLWRAGGRVFSVHLRDAITPRQPIPFLAAVPLGHGDLDWQQIFSAAQSAEIDMYIVEMQTQGRMDPIEAYRISADFIRDLEI